MLKRNNVWEYGEGLLQACISSITVKVLKIKFFLSFSNDKKPYGRPSKVFPACRTIHRNKLQIREVVKGYFAPFSNFSTCF